MCVDKKIYFFLIGKNLGRLHKTNFYYLSSLRKSILNDRLIYPPVVGYFVAVRFDNFQSAGITREVKEIGGVFMNHFRAWYLQ